MIKILSKAFSATRDFFSSAGHGTVDRLVETVEYMQYEKDTRVWGDPDEILSPYNDGLWIGSEYAMEGYLFGRNALCLGGSGTGKSSTLIYPTLLNAHNRSFVVHDPSGQVYMDTCSALEQRGYKTFLFDPNDVAHSDSINFMHFIESAADLNKLSAQIVKTTLGDKASDPYWGIAAASLLRLLMGLVLRYPDKPMHTMANVLHLLRAFGGGNTSGLDRYVVRRGTEEQLMEYKNWLGGNDKTTASVTMSLTASLELWTNPNVQQVTSSTTVDMASFRRQPTVLFIRNQTLNAPMYAPLMSIVMELLMKTFMSEEGQVGLGISFLIDECPTLSPLPSLSQFVSNSRKHNLSSLLIGQSQYQFYQAFGENDGKNILANMYTRLYYTSGADMQTCEELEKVIGKEAVVDANGKRSMQAAMPAARMRTLPQNTGVLLVGGYKPFLLNVVPYYKDPYLQRYTRMRHNPRVHNHSKNLSLIPLSNE